MPTPSSTQAAVRQQSAARYSGRNTLPRSASPAGPWICRSACQALPAASSAALHTARSRRSEVCSLPAGRDARDAWSAASTSTAGTRASRALPTSWNAVLPSSVTGPASKLSSSSVHSARHPAVAWMQVPSSAAGPQPAGARCGDHVASAAAAGRRPLQAHRQGGAREAGLAAVGGSLGWLSTVARLAQAAPQLAAESAHLRQSGACAASEARPRGSSPTPSPRRPVQAARRASPRFPCSATASKPPPPCICSAISSTSRATGPRAIVAGAGLGRRPALVQAAGGRP